MKCEECLVQSCCSGEEVKCLLQQISETKPFIIVINGNSDPTYSSCSFFECLITEPIKFEFGQQTKFKPVDFDITIEEWIWKTIKGIDPEYTIIKFKGVYVVGEYSLKDPPYFTEEHGLCIDYGGTIELYYK